MNIMRSFGHFVGMDDVSKTSVPVIQLILKIIVFYFYLYVFKHIKKTVIDHNWAKV